MLGAPGNEARDTGSYWIWFLVIKSSLASNSHSCQDTAMFHAERGHLPRQVRLLRWKRMLEAVARV